MSYVDEVIAKVSEKNAQEPEFLQTVEEVLSSLKPIVDKNEEVYRKAALLERMCEPERVIELAVKGMLPHNRLGRATAKKLFVYAGAEHKHSAQQPESITID